MRNGHWIAAMLLLMAGLLCAAGCSPTQKAWVQRASTGVTNDAENDDKLIDLAKDGVQAKEDDAIRSASAQIIQVLDGKLIDPDTDAPVELTPEYVDRTMKILQAQLAEIQKQRETVFQAKTDNDENRRQINEALHQIERLNTAWAGGAEAISSQLADLAGQVAELRRQSDEK